MQKNPGFRKKNKRNNSSRKNDEGFDKRIVSIRRVSRVNKGGKRMRLSVCVVIGDKKGKVGIGLGKGSDVRSAEEKAVKYAKKHIKEINLKDNTIPHGIVHKKGAAKIMIKPASAGTGVVAGSSLRAVLEVVGVKDVLTKILGTSNQITNAYAIVEALDSLKSSRFD